MIVDTNRKKKDDEEREWFMTPRHIWEEGLREDWEDQRDDDRYDNDEYPGPRGFLGMVEED